MRLEAAAIAGLRTEPPRRTSLRGIRSPAAHLKSLSRSAWVACRSMVRVPH